MDPTLVGLVDVHQHAIPSSYRALLERKGIDADGWPLPAWDANAALAMMDQQGIATGVLSVSAPGVHLGDDGEARGLARSVNEFGAELVRGRPDRFGCFASLPLPDVDGSLAEIAYATDVLGVDGFVVMSNLRGRYLGDPAFAPVWEELDRRAAVVFVHPTSPPLAALPGLPGPLIDYPFDTTRTAMSMVVAGVMSRHRRMAVILSHAGGFLPYAAYRFTGAAQFGEGLTPDGILDDCRRFYFDTALSATPSALPSLLAFADPEHILFGSDWPFAPIPAGTSNIQQLQTDPGLDGDLRRSIAHGNAQRLFPRLSRNGHSQE